MEMFANLHTHSTHSDGVYAPAEIVRIAKAEGYKAVAVTDHDTQTGFPELEKACKDEKMECIFGVEFSTPYKNTAAHIVAFDFDPEYPPMKEYLEKMGKRQTYGTKECFDYAVAKCAISGVTWEEILKKNESVRWLCNNHIFKVMKEKGLVKQEGYMNWYKQNFSSYPPGFKHIYSFNNLPDMVKLIKDAGGLAVLAHPHNMLDDIEYFIRQGIEGIEVWHPDLSQEERERAFEIALEKKLYISGGCDHSGLCGGLYDSFETEEELKSSYHYIEPLSVGTTEGYFREIKERKLLR